MSPKESVAPPVFDFAAMVEFGQKQANALSEMQKELSASIEQASRHWLARAEQERNLANESMTRLFGTKSIPEAAGVYQDWISRRMATTAEDNQKLVAETQKFMTSGSKLWNGGLGVGT